MPALAFTVRVKEEQEHALYVRRELYIGIRRDWPRGTKTLFVKKDASGDFIIGSAALEKIVELDAMDSDEKQFCIENNWYGRMVFAMLARFLTPLPVSETTLAGRPPALLHGLAVPDGEASAIEDVAGSRLIT